MTKLVRISTPILRRLSISVSTIAFGRRNSGMPYMSTPPGFCSASKSVTSCPSRRTSTAKVIEAGPPPITATFRPVAGFTGGGSARPASRSRSAA